MLKPHTKEIVDLTSIRMQPYKIEMIKHPKIRLMLEHLKLVNGRIGLGNKIALLWDVDVDGIFAGFIAYKQIQRMFPKIEIHNYINKEKSHGIKKRLINYIKQHEIQTLIIVDAGSNDITEIKELIDNGVKVIVIDHHEISERFEDDDFILINSKECEIGQEVSGAYLVNDVFKQIGMQLNITPTKEYDELGVLTIVSDICKRDLFNRNVLLNYTMGLIELSPFLKVMKKGYHGTSINSLISITSSINALLRKFGTEELMRIILHDDTLLRTIFYNTNKIKTDNEMIIYDIMKESKTYELSDIVVVIIKSTQSVNVRDYSSLISNRMSTYKQKTCVVLVRREDTLEETESDFDYIYSVRDYYSRDILTAFKGLNIDANGHQPAFGGKLKGDVVKTIKEMNESVKGVQIDSSIYGKVIDTTNLELSLTEYMGDLFQIASWNAISMREEKVGFSFIFKGDIIKKRRVTELLYGNLKLTTFDKDIVEGDTLVCYPELDSTVKLMAAKFN